MKVLILIFTIIPILMTTNNLLGQEGKLMTNLSIDHIVKYPTTYKADSDKKYPLIITLHGHGSNEEDLIGLSEHLQEELLWVSGRGPVTLRKGSYDWYQLPPTPDKIATTLKTIHSFIEELKKTYPTPY